MQNLLTQQISYSVIFVLFSHEEVVLLYQQLQSAGVPQLLRKYERIVGSFYKEIKDQKDENQRLQHVFETLVLILGFFCVSRAP